MTCSIRSRNGGRGSGVRDRRSAMMKITNSQQPMTNDQLPAKPSIAKQLVIGCWLLAIGYCMSASTAFADQRLGDFCRIKGQEENVLHGMGLVVGLKGTGDSDSK